MNNIYRNVYCGEVTKEYIGKEVRIAGWIDSIRNLGSLVFMVVRDETGIVQLISNDVEKLSKLNKESTITVTGIVNPRTPDMVNPNMKTGEIEIEVKSYEVLGECTNVLPFEIKKSKESLEDTRLKYRYLDLRNKEVHDNIVFRTNVIDFIRSTMKSMRFLEVQTPIITSSSPEGARDFIIPSRKFKGKFYALPQAPQIFKQLLMVSGFDRYFQIAPCFRDEDARSDRTLEFYQLDLEMNFVTEEEVLLLGEEIFHSVFTKYSDKKVSPKPFRRISYNDSMEMYGTDKPDLRNPLIIKDISKILENTTFGPFKSSIIKAIVVDDIGDKSNSWFNEIVDYASSIGMPGIGYLTLTKDKTFKGPIDKFLNDTERKDLIEFLSMKENSVVFFIANKNKKVAQKFSGQIRTYLGNKLNLIDENRIELCIINDFPMFEYDEKLRKYEFCHNPFSLPHESDIEYNKDNMDEILAYQYDFVCNGNEMASGAIRNSNVESLIKGFEAVGYKRDEVERKFQSLITAFKYGCPPHGGMALGIDRIIMIIKDESNLREVQAFPVSTSGQDLMMGSPSTLEPKQLEELGIKIKEE